MAQKPPQQKPPPQSHPVADQFSDDEMEQVQRHGQALSSGEAFSDEVEKELEKRGAYQRAQERSAAKMRAAQTSTSPGLGPTEAEQTLAKQQQSLQQQAATTGAVSAQQAQAGQSGQPPAPPAPSGPQGVTTPYPAQKGEVGGSGNLPQGSQGGPPSAPEAPPEGGAEEQS